MKLATKILSGAALTLALISNASASLVDWSFTADSSSADITAASFSYDTDTKIISNILSTGAYWTFDPNRTPSIDSSKPWTIISFGMIFLGRPNTDSIAAQINTKLDQVTTTGGSIYYRSGTWTSTARAATATAVPEPEAYAMMLAGLGLVGFAARRKQQAV